MIYQYPKPLLSGCFPRAYSHVRDILYPFYRGLSETDFYNYDRKSGAISKYQNAVFDLLDKAKGDADIHHPESLIELQKMIESRAYPYDSMKNIYQAAPQIMKLLIQDDEPTARSYLLENEEYLTFEERIFIKCFHRHTIEGIIVHIFGLVFNSIDESPAVRLSTLVDQLDRAVRTQALMMYERDKTIEGEFALDGKHKNVGILLVEFLLERNLITITNDLSISSQKIEIKDKKGRFYKKRASYVFCNFDVGIIPIQLNLPMVCPPKDWHVAKPAGGKPTSLSDLTGGYLYEPVGDIYLYNRYKLLAARDKDKFNILLNDNYQEICDAMNSLQKESFEINVVMLDYIKANYLSLVREGLLKPRILASINIPVAIKSLRDTFLKYENRGSITYQSVLDVFLADVQRARYEDFILDIASAYAGYEFYLPAFVDFRGRIYRSGVLHFHERDIARSLIVFSRRTVKESKMNTPPPKGGPAIALNMYLAATAFHYKKYPSYEEALQAGLDLESIKTPEDLIERASTARDPYQYISKVVTLGAESTKVSPDQLPITQDASASAYQIISYFMLDFQLAKYTNLIPTKVRNSEHLRINDIYDFFLSELIEYLKAAGNIIFKDGSIIIKYVCPLLHRNLVKSLLMPLVYGKTAYSMADNLYNELNTLLGKKECLELARHIEIFFKKRFPHIVNLMSLIRAVGWVVSASGAPVYYSTPMFTTVQDYMKSEAVNIWLYDRQSKKRRQVTLRVPTPERDRRKTTSAIFANFIHQKDAIIAFNMIKNVKKRGIPIYTVHDNFITTMDFSHAMGESYIEILLNSPHPMEYINSFLAINLFDEARTPGRLCQIDLDGCFAVDELHSRLDNIPCPKEYTLTKKKREIWYKRLTEISQAYYHYILSIRFTDSAPIPKCIKSSSDSSYYTRLDKYRKEMRKWMDYPYIYSLHL